MALPRHAVLIFGRFQPPTKGHERLFKTAVAQARRFGAHVYVFPSQTQNADNPLSFEQKVKLIAPAMRTFSDFHIGPKSVKSPYDSLTWAHQQGFSAVTMYVGDDRLVKFKQLASRWSINEDPSNTMKIAVSSLPREGAMSASKVSGTVARQAARAGDFQKFQQVLIGSVPVRDAKAAMSAIQQMKEEHDINIEIEINGVVHLMEERDNNKTDWELNNAMHAVFEEEDENDEVSTKDSKDASSSDDLVVIFDDDDDSTFSNTLQAVFDENSHEDDSTISETDEDPAIKDETLGAVNPAYDDTEDNPVRYPTPNITVEKEPVGVSTNGRVPSDTPEAYSVVVINPKRHLRHDLAVKAQEYAKNNVAK